MFFFLSLSISSFQGNISFGLKRYVPPGFPRQTNFWFPNVFTNVQSVMDGDVRFYCAVKIIQGRAFKYDDSIFLIYHFPTFFLSLVSSLAFFSFSFRLDYRGRRDTYFDVIIPYDLFYRLLRLFLADWNSSDRFQNAARGRHPLPTRRQLDVSSLN